MNLYHDEKAYLNKFRERIIANENIPARDILQLIDRFEEMTEMTSVTIKIIDRLMKNYDQLKQEVHKGHPTQKKDILDS